MLTVCYVVSCSVWENTSLVSIIMGKFVCTHKKECRQWWAYSQLSRRSCVILMLSKMTMSKKEL